ncbi:hypothetical protein A9Q74_00285 [Colwellia sp. 39_35_sub15_T18]|nr:hypothetical protein A9Q74_00285 [Colwellia sp. 39_35_sub15_T18]
MLKIKSVLTLVLSLFTFAVFAGATPQISQQDLITAFNKGAANMVILDVRSADEYQHGHIAGAINMSYDTVEENLSQLTQYKKSTLVVYCRSGRRAGIAEHILSSNGFNDIRHLTGDMNSWVEAKLPVVNNKPAHK